MFETLIEMDTCHNLMISEPERLAQILRRALSALCPMILGASGAHTTTTKRARVNGPVYE